MEIGHLATWNAQSIQPISVTVMNKKGITSRMIDGDRNYIMTIIIDPETMPAGFKLVTTIETRPVSSIMVEKIKRPE